MSQIWIISDEKPGHLNQSLGLFQALKRHRADLQSHQLPPLTTGQLFQRRWPDRFAHALESGTPALVIGAGHSTHITLLYLKWRLASRVLVLMKPTLPSGLFDLCLIPEHDQPPEAAHIITTRGALNPMQPGEKRAGSTLVLLGGPSRHSAWDEAAVLKQLQQIAEVSPTLRVTSSRRTPPSTIKQLQQSTHIEFIPATETPVGWLARQLAETETCWVSQDSVSMVYEALSAGCAVGVLEVAQKRRNRLGEGLQKLADAGIITFFSHWQGAPLHKPPQVFDEADRCARQILARGWL